MSSDEYRALPPNYQAVLDVVNAAGPGSHVTAQEIWLRTRTVRPQIGFATVHRALARLHDTGAVLKVDVPGGAATVYEAPAGPHAHFRCTSCGAIADVDYAVPAGTRRSLARRHGIAIAYEEVTFSGRCARCS